MNAPTTPSSVYSENSLEHTPHTGPGGMQYAEKARYRLAASRARRIYPGPVGELVARELQIVEEFGWALGAQSFGTKLVAAIESTPIPTGMAEQSTTRGV